MDVQVAQTLYHAIDEGLKSTITTGTAKVMTATGVIFGTCWLIHLTMKSIHWLFQGLDVALEDLLLTILKAALIIFFAFNVKWYVETIVPVVNGLPNGITQLLSTSSVSQTNLVDNLLQNFYDSIVKILDNMSFSIFTKISVWLLHLLAFILFVIGAAPFILVCVGTLITLKAATSIILVVGPVFIAFSLFEQTRQYFWGWVSVLSGFMLTQIFFGIVLTLEMNFINANIVVPNGEPPTLLECFAILLYFGAFTLLATELPNYAASIMGGTPSGGVTGVGGILGRGTGLGTAGRMANATRKGIGKLRNRNRIT